MLTRRQSTVKEVPVLPNATSLAWLMWIVIFHMICVLKMRLRCIFEWLRFGENVLNENYKQMLELYKTGLACWVCKLVLSEIPLMEFCSSEITTKCKPCFGGKIRDKTTARLGRHMEKKLPSSSMLPTSCPALLPSCVHVYMLTFDKCQSGKIK